MVKSYIEVVRFSHVPVEHGGGRRRMHGLVGSGDVVVAERQARAVRAVVLVMVSSTVPTAVTQGSRPLTQGSPVVLWRGVGRGRERLVLSFDARVRRRRLGGAGALLWVIIVVPLVPLVSVKLGSVHSFDVLPERRRVGVPLGATGGFASVGFLWNKSSKINCTCSSVFKFI